MGVKISKRSSTYKSQPNVFKLVDFPPNGPHKTTLGIFLFWVSDFKRILVEILKFTFVPYEETKRPQMSGKRVIVEQIGMKFGTQ